MADRSTFKRITIQLRGDPAEGEHLRLSDFLNQLDAIRGALNNLEEDVTGSEKRSIYYRVVDLKHSSPATIVLDAIPVSATPDITDLVVDRFVDGMRQIARGIAPKDFSYTLYESFKKVAAPLHKRVSGVVIETDGRAAEVTREIETEIDKIVGPDEFARGSISGTLEYLNVHADANVFRIYPIVGPKKVECHFPKDLLPKALAGVTKYVSVEGELRYKSNEPFAYAINVSDLEVFPSEDELPSILDLRGIDPAAGANMRSEDFVRQLRDAGW